MYASAVPNTLTKPVFLEYQQWADQSEDVPVFVVTDSTLMAPIIGGDDWTMQDGGKLFGHEEIRDTSCLYGHG